MRDPNSVKFQRVQQLMRSGNMVGKDRPVGRVTWQKSRVKQIRAGHQGMGAVRYIDKNGPEHELGSIRTIEIDRSIGQDAATCTITMYNNDWTTTQPEGIDTAGRVGYLSPGRGEPQKKTHSIYTTMSDPFDPQLVQYPTTWDFSVNPYRDVLVPNTMLKTYQGYGSDNFDISENHIAIGDTANGYVAPEDDSQLFVTGIWLIDHVTFAADGTITVECRDLGKLLIEQYIYPHLLPIDRFPLIYCPAGPSQGHKEYVGRNVAVYDSSSVDHKRGANAAVLGHRGTDAFDDRPGSYWLSTGNNSIDAYEWLQAKTHGPVNEVELNCWGGGYRVYVSVHENGKWQGTDTIPGASNNNLDYQNDPGSSAGYYVHNVVTGDTLWDLAQSYYGKHELWPILAKANNNITDPHWIYPGQTLKVPYVRGTNFPPSGDSGPNSGSGPITYVKRASVPRHGKLTIKLPRAYDGHRVRVTFTRLSDKAKDGTYRAGVRQMNVRLHKSSTFVKGNIGKPGKITDWTEPIKEMCAWAGFTWQDAGTNPPDPLLGRNPATGNALRVWGDFEFLGAGPVVCTPADYFMSKSFMDGIRQIVDFIGGIFYVDETGGAQFRLPNIWSSGNFIDDVAANALSARIKHHPIEFHEDANILSYEMQISDEAVRSEVLVIGGYTNVHQSAPVAGGYVLGYNNATHETSAIDFTDVLAGQYRLMVLPGDNTKFIYTEEECQRMAELTALFILFSYRQGTLKAPCHPGLQLDDQVRIFERVTSEQNIHYVSGISSTMDVESGEYTMAVTTHWLGGDPNTQWFINKEELSPAVLELPAIVKRVGKEAGGDEFEHPPYGTG